MWTSYIEEGLKKANATAVSNASKIQKFAILDGDLSVRNGDLTATLKLRRQVFVQRDDVKAAMKTLYGDDLVDIWVRFPHAHTFCLISAVSLIVCLSWYCVYVCICVCW